MGILPNKATAVLTISGGIELFNLKIMLGKVSSPHLIFTRFPVEVVDALVKREEVSFERSDLKFK